MQQEKTLQQQILEENEIINDYKSQLEIAYRKYNQINKQYSSLDLVKKGKSYVKKCSGFVILGLLMIGLMATIPLITHAMEIIAFSLAVSMLTIGLVAELIEKSELKQQIKQDPYYNSFKNLSKKECNKKQQELSLAKNNEQKNIESLEECLEAEHEELLNLISKMSYKETLKETVGKELEKTFLRYLDEDIDYQSIHFDNQPQEKVKIKSKVR